MVCGCGLVRYSQRPERSMCTSHSDTNKGKFMSERSTAIWCHSPFSNWTLLVPLVSPILPVLYPVKQTFSRRTYYLRQSTWPSFNLIIILVVPRSLIERFLARGQYRYAIGSEGLYGVVGQMNNAALRNYWGHRLCLKEQISRYDCQSVLSWS